MNDQKIHILAIDTSCDETAVSVLQNDWVLSNVVASQVEIHQPWGGVYPSLAKRAHEEQIEPCIIKAIERSGVKDISKMQAIAVTYGPGLALSLEIGVNKAKELAKEFGKPLIGVNHMEGHVLSPLLRNSKGNLYANLPEIEFPSMAMTVSGGHTEIVWVEEVGKYKIIGRTLDDAAGEAFDKIARMLGLGYPGGPIIERMALDGDSKSMDIPIPMRQRKGYDFSYSGIKTHCLYRMRDLKKEVGEEMFAKMVPDFCASAQESIIDSLILKLKKAAKKLNPKMILVGGGVTANNRLRHKFRQTFRKLNFPVFFPHSKFCMDNAAMIGLTAYFKYKRGEFVKNKETLDRDPALSIEDKNIYE